VFALSLKQFFVARVWSVVGNIFVELAVGRECGVLKWNFHLVMQDGKVAAKRVYWATVYFRLIIKGTFLAGF
jgi:hypothetical protein